MFARIEFSYPNGETVLAIHGSNGAILGVGKTREQALFAATQSIAQAWRDLGHDSVAYQITVAADRIVP